MSQSRTDQYYQELATECDQLIKAGQFARVNELMTALNFSQVPREHRQVLAKVCRRVGLVSLGLRLLHSVVRHDRGVAELPTPGEVCEYAVLLSRNGSVQEAIKLLETVSPDEIPEASLYLGYCQISNWEYATAVGYLEKFLVSNADEYTKLVARVNLISCYLAIYEFDKAEALLATTLSQTETAKATRLAGNCYEMQGRISLQKQQFSQARENLESAYKMFGGNQSYDWLFTYKWEAVMSAVEQNSAQPLLDFKNQAILKKQWENVREADLYTLKIEFKQSLLDYLCYGTPLHPYRERILREVGKTPSGEFIFGSTDGLVLDLSTGDLQGGQELNPGKKVHQTIACLIKDFYSPRTMGSLFAELYPDEYFDVNSSPLRLRKLLSRTRQWLEEQKLAASIEHLNGSYRFVVNDGFGVRMQLAPQKIDSFRLHWNQVRALVPPGKTFNAKKICDSLNWPRSNFLLIAERALELGLMSREGQGKNTVYRIPESVQLHLSKPSVKPAA